MKKRTFRALLCLGLFAMTLTSCGNTNPYADDPRYPIYQLALDSGFTGTYQEWLDSIKCEDGQNGETPHIGENGNWWIGDTDTGVPARGPQGTEGPQSEPGNAEEMIVAAIEKTAYANNGTISYNFKSDGYEQSMIVKIADQKAETHGIVFEGYPYVGSVMFDVGMGTNHKFKGLVDKGDGHYHADSITMNLNGEKFLEFIGCSLGQGEIITNNNIEYVIKNVEIHIEDGYIVSMEYDVEQTLTADWRDVDTFCYNVKLGMEKAANGHFSYKFSDIGTTVIEGSSTPSEE